MKSGKKVIRVALAILCMVSMLFISEYQKVEVYAASGYGFIFLSAYEKTLKTGDTYLHPVIQRSHRLIPTEKSPQKRREVRRSRQKQKMRRQAVRLLSQRQKLP